VLEIVSGDFRFTGWLEEEAAPATVAGFRRLLPLESRIIHARWSGEACWIPFGDLDVDFGPENATCYPAPGQLLFYPGGVSETEILFPYGSASFASKAGALAGNHFATIRDGVERLGELGRKVLWEGAQPIRFEEKPPPMGHR
jgi:Protein of unknown function (DUF3830)